jgi:cell division protein FtsX
VTAIPTRQEWTRAVEDGKTVDFDVEVFLQVSASPPQIEFVRSSLLSDADITMVRYLDQHAALQEFPRRLADRPKLLRAVTERDLPGSFQIDVSSTRDLDQVVGDLGTPPAVESVGSPWLGVCGAAARGERR